MGLNYTFYEPFGKILFALFDAVAVYFLWHIIAKIPQKSASNHNDDKEKDKNIDTNTQKEHDKKIQHANFVAQLYGYNPLFLYLTVRGSC
jgi:hypothetical protein